MMPAYLHEQLIKACKDGNINEVKKWLDAGAEVNFNIQRPTNALHEAIEIDHQQIITLLLEHGAKLKEYVLQKAIEKDKDYLALLVPNLKVCKEQSLLMGILQAAINTGDLDLAQQAIHQGAKPKSLFLSSILNLNSTKILKLLLENGFNIHADKNMILTQWMGSPVISGWGDNKRERHDLLAFISDYYIDKPQSIEKFDSLRLTDKSLLFRIGLNNNNFNMMKFAVLIGATKNEALNSALYRYYAYKQENRSTHSSMFKDHKSTKVDYQIIEYLLNSNIEFKQATISNAVCFKYTKLLNALNRKNDLEYAYEMAYKYENDNLCEYFLTQGVSNEAANFSKMKVSASQGNIKALRQAVNDGADVKKLDKAVIVALINGNQIESLKYLYNSGVLLDASFNEFLDRAMSLHKAYESITYLVELGLDITLVKNMPQAYKNQYPTIANMWEKRFSDIFNYTIYLAKEMYPKAEGKQKEEVLEKIAELSSLPYVIQRSKEKALAD